MELYNFEMIFMIITGILMFNYILEHFLDYLNSTYWSNKLPDELIGIYDPGEYKKSQEYEKTKHNFHLVISNISFLAIIIMLAYDGFAILDLFVRSITINPILMALLFFGILGFASDILSIPFSIYSTFVIEEKYGFNKTTIKTFITDKIKGWFLSAIIGGGLLALIVWIFVNTGNIFWIVAWASISLFMIFITMFYSTLIVPIFNKQTPLEKGELRTAIEKFAKDAGFNIDNIFVIDGSKRSTKANAYFSGLGSKKRIVLFDTLINNHSIEELVAVLAHEIGHYKKKHTLIGVIISVFQLGIMLFLLSWFIKNPELSKALGAENHSFHLGILVFSIIYSPLSLILGLVMNSISRKNEFSADKYAGINYKAKALQGALKKLSINTLSNLRPHPLYVFFHFSHPPLLQRLKKLDKLKKV